MLEQYEFYNKEYDMNDYMWILYDFIGEGVVVKRVLATNPCITIPSMLAGRNVVSIGSYCFAQNGHLSEEETLQVEDKLNEDFGLCEMCGIDVQEVQLPDTVVTLESYAFYQCRELSLLEVGKGLLEVHNDVFMNCRKLHYIRIRGNISESTGAKFLLSRLNLDVEMEFSEGDHARVFYPEYIESYEEIGPAHIFELNVEGEGYRARQCFQDGVVDIQKYDDIFEKSTNLENFDVLLQMALDRLMYPVHLCDEARNRYETFIEKNGQKILLYVVQHENINQLEYLGQLKLIQGKDYERGIEEAVHRNWTKGSAMLIRIAGEQKGE